MNPFAFYFQGSHVVAVFGLTVLLALLIWSLCSKLPLLQSQSRTRKFGVWALVTALWCASFINVGHKQNELNRQKFDTVHQAVDAPEIEAVTRTTSSLESVRAAAKQTRQNIEQESK